MLVPMHLLFRYDSFVKTTIALFITILVYFPCMAFLVYTHHPWSTKAFAIGLILVSVWIFRQRKKIVADFPKTYDFLVTSGPLPNIEAASRVFPQNLLFFIQLATLLTPLLLLIVALFLIFLKTPLV